jgi:hypothetical protein
MLASVKIDRNLQRAACQPSHNYLHSQQMNLFSRLLSITIGLGCGLDAATTILSPSPVLADRQASAEVIGTKVSLTKPAGFTTAKTFSGFQQDSTQASIVVTEIPAAYQQVTADFTAANLKTRGINQLGRENIKIAGYPGLLVRVTQSANGTTYNKWIAVFGDDKETVSIVATLPQAGDASLFRSLRTSITSAKWNRTKVVDPLAGLQFTATATPDLKFTKRIQNALLYTKDGVIPAADPNDPLLVVTQAISTVVVVDPQQYAQKRLAQTQQAKNIQITSTTPITIDKLQGYEIIADAVDPTTDRPIVVYQVMLFEGQTYYIMQGLVGSNAKSKYLPEFKKIATSFRKR